MNKGYKGRREVFNLEDYEKVRKYNVSYKMGAVDTARTELEGIIDFEKLGEQYLDLTGEEIFAKLKGCLYLKNEEAFTDMEFAKLVEAFRDIADRLNGFADEIESATND